MQEVNERIQEAHREKMSRLLEATRWPAPALGAAEGQSLDAVGACDALNDAHCTGMLVQRILGDGPPLISFRSRSHFGGRQRLGQVQLCIYHGGATRPAVYQRLLEALGLMS